NAELMRSGFYPPPAFTSGTTVVGLVFDKGVMIGTDTRATRGNLVTSSTSEKIFRLHDNVYCAGAGTASDLQKVTSLLKSKLDMHHVCTNSRKVRVNCAKEMAKEVLTTQQSRLFVSFIFGGVDRGGLHLYSLNFDGTTSNLLYHSIGSGQFGSMSILENRWQLDMCEDEARELIVDAVSAGINNDLFSGSSVVVCIIRKDYSVEHCTEPIHLSSRNEKQAVQPVRLGMTSVHRTWVHDIEVTDEKVYSLPPLLP
ncbi:hypothetical protein KR222_008937, partial [Zaprionus bogoriensis]